MSHFLARLLSLCDQVKAEIAIKGVKAVELELVAILNLLKTHDDAAKREAKLFFKKIVSGAQSYPIEIVIFCMRELQWPEIKTEATIQIKKTDDWRIIDTMENVRAVYETHWPEGNIYTYYKKDD